MNEETGLPVHAVFNYAEAGLWLVIALVLAVRLRMKHPWRWLLVMKAACVLVFLLAWGAHRRQGKPHG